MFPSLLCILLNFVVMFMFCVVSSCSASFSLDLVVGGSFFIVGGGGLPPLRYVWWLLFCFLFDGGSLLLLG